MTQQLFPSQIRKIIIEQAKRANVGHIGSALSVVDIIAALYFEVMKISSPTDPDRDRFILSKRACGSSTLCDFFPEKLDYLRNACYLL